MESDVATKQMKQVACAQAGAIQALVHAFHAGQTLEAQWQPIRAIGQMSFKNPHVCRVISHNEQIFTLLCSLLNHCDEEIILQASYVLNLVASNAPEAHVRLVELCPRMVSILRNESLRTSTRVNGIRFFSHLSYSPSLTQSLIQCGCLQDLVWAANSQSMELRFTTAAIAVANIVANQAGTNVMDESKLSFGSSVVPSMLEAFKATIVGNPFPPESTSYYTDWKLAQGISNMCRSPMLRDQFLDFGILAEISYALCIPDSANGKFHEAVLKILWQVAS
eukprot:c12222_g1_i1.p1 GENE.c12222_g1_i1~~c12222_g1_i1.p1  ORF type:complete len:279 (+),score=58.48 c12222_g1_i1:189-1025(+)